MWPPRQQVNNLVARWQKASPQLNSLILFLSLEGEACFSQVFTEHFGTKYRDRCILGHGQHALNYVQFGAIGGQVRKKALLCQRPP